MSDLVRELAHGLARADTDLAIRADAIAMFVENVASVPAVRVAPLATGRRPGFDAILFDIGGTPTHFCRCRPAGDAEVAHEVAVVRAASTDPSLARHLRRSALAATSRLSASVSPYEEGLPYDSFIARQSTADWAASVEAVVDITERMAPLVARALPDLMPSGPVAFAEAGGPTLAQLAALEVPSTRRDALHRALVAGGVVRPVPQHGHLRPENLLYRDVGWLLLEPGNFAEIWTPLYDVFHLLHTSLARRRTHDTGAQGSWIDALRDPSDDSTAARAILRRAVRRHGLSPEAALAALAHYLLDQAGGAHGGGPRRQFRSGCAGEAARLAELLRQGAGPVAFGLASA